MTFENDVTAFLSKDNGANAMPVSLQVINECYHTPNTITAVQTPVIQIIAAKTLTNTRNEVFKLDASVYSRF